VSCKRIQDELSAYLDGQLPDGEKARVREHLATCPRCAAGFEDLKALGRLVDELDGMPVPAGFAERVRRSAETPADRRAAVVRPLAASPPQSIGSLLLGGTLTRIAAVLMVAFGLWVGLSLGGTVGAAGTAAGGAAVSGTAQSSDEEADPLDLPIGSLSAAPAGSLTEVYLAMESDDE
jgi:anti-sigma factor RsiW